MHGFYLFAGFLMKTVVYDASIALHFLSFLRGNLLNFSRPTLPKKLSKTLFWKMNCKFEFGSYLLIYVPCSLNCNVLWPKHFFQEVWNPYQITEDCNLICSQRESIFKNMTYSVPWLKVGNVPRELRYYLYVISVNSKFPIVFH